MRNYIMLVWGAEIDYTNLPDGEIIQSAVFASTDDAAQFFQGANNTVEIIPFFVKMHKAQVQTSFGLIPPNVLRGILRLGGSPDWITFESPRNAGYNSFSELRT
jgi:hypothetical protein